MALFRKFFYRKPPDGLLEISERVYVFDCCFTTDILEEDEYKAYMRGIVGKLGDHLPDASFMVFNFREGENQTQIAGILSEYDMIMMDYPQHYEGCPVLRMEMIHHFLRSCESWLSLGQQNVLLMHCERGGWSVLSFMLAALLLYRKHFTGEQKTLDMIYKQAPRELLQLMSPLNPLASHLRYLHYISRRTVSPHWPPLDRALTLDCIILRVIPNLDGKGGCCPILRVYGQDPLMTADRSPKVLFSTPKKSKLVRHYKQADGELVKIDIHCHIEGDVVMECISLDDDHEREQMMFRVMFNTAFIRSNIMILNPDEIDTQWSDKDKFSKDFRAELLFSEMDSMTSLALIDLPGSKENDAPPVKAFSEGHEVCSSADWQEGKTNATQNVPQQITAFEENLDAGSPPRAERSSMLMESTPESVKEMPTIKESENTINGTTSFPLGSPIMLSVKLSTDANSTREKVEPQELKVALETICSSQQSSDANSVHKKVEPQELAFALQRPAQSKIISQRATQTSLSSLVSLCNSLQGSPLPTSRYHSASSALGITALLHDHATLTGEEVVRPGTVSLPSSGISSPVTNVPKSVHLSHVSAPRPSSPAPPPPPSPLLPSSLQFSNEAPTPTGTHPCSPQRCSKSSDSSSTQQPETGNRRIQSPPPPFSRASHPSTFEKLFSTTLLPDHTSPPSSSETSLISTIKSSQSTTHPLPSFSGRSPSSAIKSPNSTTPLPPPPPPPLPSFSGRSPSSTVKSPYSTVSSTVKSPHSTVPPPPPPPRLPSFSGRSPSSTIKSPNSNPPPPPPPPLPSFSGRSPSSTVKSPHSTLPPPCPQLPSFSAASPSSTVKESCSTPPPTLPFPGVSSLAPPFLSSIDPGPPLPPPPPAQSLSPPVSSAPKDLSNNSMGTSPVPSPPAPFAKGLSKSSGASLPSLSGVAIGDVPPVPGPPSSALLSTKGRGICRTTPRSLVQPKKANLKPYHWLKLTRVMQGSLWAEPQKPDEASKTPEFDMSELETLFSAGTQNSNHASTGGKSSRRTSGSKSEKIQLIELRRAYNCEIMLSKVKIPLPDVMSSVLALDDSSLDVDQVDNLIKFCPTKEEMELLKGYNGEKENLGKCEQFFLELMKVPRVESKLRVFSFKLQFHSQVSDLRRNLNIVNSTAEEIKGSAKLKRVMQTILSLGNALNHGTARGSAIGFRLDSLLKLADTRARNNKMTLMHYLCKVLAEKLPELLYFPQDLVSLEAATKIQLKYLAEEMQAISKGMEKVVQELTASENDGPVSENFCKNLKAFLSFAESDVRSLAFLYCNVGRNADALALYFGEDPVRCPFEQVVSTLLNFLRMFVRAHDDNCKQLEVEKKRAAKDAENEKEKLKMNASKRESVNLMRTPITIGDIR